MWPYFIELGAFRAFRMYLSGWHLAGSVWTPSRHSTRLRPAVELSCNTAQNTPDLLMFPCLYGLMWALRVTLLWSFGIATGIFKCVKGTVRQQKRKVRRLACHDCLPRGACLESSLQVQAVLVRLSDSRLIGRRAFHRLEYLDSEGISYGRWLPVAALRPQVSQ